MNKTNELTAELIRRMVQEEEVPRRCRTLPPAAVTSILRYGAIVGSIIEQHEQLTRGMDRARQLIRRAEEAGRSFPSGAVILAGEMVRSKGRFARAWHAPPGGIWLTLVIANTLLPESSLLVPMAAGVACCEVLRDYGVPARIKWVNDVMAGSGKITGILTEIYKGPCFNEEYILVGIGINVNNETFPAELAGEAASVKSCLNRPSSLPEMTARLLAKLRWNIGLLYHEEARLLEVHGGVGQSHARETAAVCADGHLLLERYKSLTDICNRRVLFGFNVREDPQFEARVVGLDSCGGLILELADSSTVVRHSGEIIYLD